MKSFFAVMLNLALILNMASSGTILANDENTVLPAQLEIGDYFTLGRYYDEPIVWRYVADDENGKLILSDRIICYKAFDVSSNEDASGSHARSWPRRQIPIGNNYWGDSNIRSWLNSAAPEGKVVWLCGISPNSNPFHSSLENEYEEYANEKGFLADGNFTGTEKNAIKSVTQKSLLDQVDADLATGGSKEVWDELVDNKDWWTNIRFGTDSVYHDGEEVRGHVINPVEIRYDEICFEYITDQIFLMDIKQCWAVHENENILGDRYCHAKPTQTALERYLGVEYGSTEEEKSYYLRTPYGRPHQISREGFAAGVKILDDTGAKMSAGSFGGIRPAFYLDENNAIILSGSGTEEEPYVMDGKSGTNNEESGNNGSEDVTENEKTSVISVFYNGSELYFDQAPEIENDRVLVPMRKIFERLGAEVQWEERTRTVTAVAGETEIILQLDNPKMLKNGESIELDTPPRLKGERTLVPIRAVSEGLGAKVEWLEELERVVISK